MYGTFIEKKVCVRCEKEPLEEFHLNFKFCSRLWGTDRVWRWLMSSLMRKMCPKIYSRMFKTTRTNEKPSEEDQHLNFLCLFFFFLSIFSLYLYFLLLFIPLFMHGFEQRGFHVCNDRPLEKNWISFSEFFWSQH